MACTVFRQLPEAAIAIRTAVFMEEQGFQQEFDDIDEIAYHLVLTEADIPVGVCRVFPGEEAGTYVFGRLAVVRSMRGQGLGAVLLGEAEALVRSLGGSRLVLHAQSRVQAFYGAKGYTVFGEPDDDEGCPHVWMEKQV